MSAKLTSNLTPLLQTPMWSNAWLANTSAFRLAVWLVVAASALFGTMNISSGNQLMTVGIDRTVVIKLACSAGAMALGVFGVLSSARIRSLMLSIPAVLITAIYLLAVVASISAVASNALPCAVIGLGYVLFMATALDVLGIDKIAKAVLAGVLCHTLLAWFLYLFIPSFGVFEELLDGGLIIYRMGGVNHPNGVSRTAAIGLLLTVYLYRTNQLTNVVMILAFITIFVGAVYLARSRTVIVAITFAIGTMYLDRIFRPKSVTAAMFAALVLMSVGFVAIGTGKGDDIDTKLIAMVAKTGNSEELTSGTGRTDIWARAIELIAEKPLQGHGFGSAIILMADNLQSTHNMVLHAAMISGVGGGLALLGIMLWMIAYSMRNPNLLVRTTVVLILVCGTMEDTILETFPASTSIMWLLCCLAPCLVTDRR
jgi:exopolysaccharide production protein ExoQ